MQTTQPGQGDRLRLARRVIEAYEDAKVRGVCEDGAVEVAAQPLAGFEPTLTADLLVHGATANAGLARRLFDAVPADRATRQPGGVVNHPAWTVAHLLHYQPALLQVARGEPIADPGKHPDAGRYDAGSTPVDDPSAYPAWPTLTERYFAQHAAIVDAIRQAPPRRWAAPPDLSRWADAMRTSAHTLLALFVQHDAEHLAQLTVWCRAMGVEWAGQ